MLRGHTAVQTTHVVSQAAWGRKRGEIVWKTLSFPTSEMALLRYNGKEQQCLH